jgi:predicted permease
VKRLFTAVILSEVNEDRFPDSSRRREVERAYPRAKPKEPRECSSCSFSNIRQSARARPPGNLWNHSPFGDVLISDRSVYLTFREGSMEIVWQNLRYGFRVLAKSPGFAVMAVLTLAIGIGANTSIFTVLNSVLLRPLPYAQPDRLLILSERDSRFESSSVAYENFKDWQAQNHSFQEIALFRRRDYTITGARGPEHIDGREISAGFFTLLGVRPALGRDIRPEEDREGADPVALISYGLWQRRFGGKDDVIGKTVHLTAGNNDRNYTIVGVAPKEFWFYTPSDVFVAVGATNEMWLKQRLEREGSRVIARLKPGVGLSQAGADMDAIARKLATAYPEANAGHGVSMVSMLDYTVSDIRGELRLVFGAVALLLLIACVNVANLLLSRVAPRQRELAIRMALGASRRRVAAQLLTESVLLAVLGGIAGLGLAWTGTRALLRSLPDSLPRAETIGIDQNVAFFLLVTCLATGILFGLAPVWQSLRSNVNATLKEGSRGSGGGRHHLLQSVLVISELALALVLLVCSGLTIRTMAKLGKVDPGFKADNVVTFNLGFSRLHYDQPAKVRLLLKNVLDRLESIAGVEAVASTNDLMMADDSEAPFYVAERPKPDPKDYNFTMFYVTSPLYLRTMDIRLLRGRFFTDQDDLSATNVAVIDEELAHSIFPKQDPLGQHIILPFPGADQPREIVGIVQHVKHWGLAQDATAAVRSEFYMPMAQVPDQIYALVHGMTYAVRTRLEPEAARAAITHELNAIDADMPVYDVQTMNEIIRSSLARQRFATVLFLLFAAAALALGAIGTYGVLSYAVSQRTHEMGVRMALGAGTPDILRLVLQRGARLIAAGIGIGLVAAFGLSRLLASMLYGVTTTDPATFAAVSLVLVAVAIAACYIPARRATKVDPIIALRYE